MMTEKPGTAHRDSKPGHIEVGANHRRGITVALVLLDEMLCDFEKIACGGESSGVLYRERNNLSSHQRRELLGEIGQMRGLLQDVMSTLKLPPKIEDLQHQVWARSLAFWAVLVETLSKRLRRYGEVSSELATYLDPRVEKLIEHLTTIAGIAEDSCRDAAAATNDHRKAAGEESNEDAGDAQKAQS